MLNSIIAFSIRNKLIIGLFLVLLIGKGVYEITRLPIDAVPDITNNQVQVITVAPALGAPDVERLITFPIEQANSNVPGLLELRSFSRFGLSVVTLVFNDQTDVYWARQQVSERLIQVQDLLPKGFGSPVLAPVTTGLGEIYQYSLRPKKGFEHRYDAMDLRTMQDWIVRRQLLGVEGVAEVSSFGGLLKQYEIAVDPAKLMALQLSIGDVFNALENNNQNTGGAYIEKGPTALFIRTEGLIGSVQDIENILVKTQANGVPLLLRDVAEVRQGHAPRYGAMTYNGEAQVAGAVVMMLKGANSNVVIKNIKARMAEIQRTLPEGVLIEPFLDRTKMVNNAIGTVGKNLLEGALIVIFVLVVFLGNFRAGLLVASVIPLSMLFAIILMNLFGVSGNLMSLGALDFGLIVDGAVIIVEAVMHRLSHSKHFRQVTRLTQGEMNHEVEQSASRMMNSAVFGQVIILIVYLPIFALQGIEGKMFKPMAQTVAFALLGAFVLSLTYVPMMATLFLNKTLRHTPTWSDRMLFRLERVYEGALRRSLHWKRAILTVVLLMMAVSVWLLTRLGGEFIPSLPEGDFAVETRVMPGSNLQTSIDAVSKGSKILLAQFPEVKQVVGKTGTSEVPTDPMPIDASDMMIILKDRKEWTSAKTYEELEAKMSKALEAVPGVSFGFQYPVAMRFNELISGARQDVVCKIFGENLDTLAHYAAQLGEICHGVQGTSGVYVEAVTGMPQIIIRYHRAAIAQYGLNISDVNRTVNAAFAGQQGGIVYEGEKRFDLVVRLSGEKRRDLADVQQLLVRTPAGNQVPLYLLADIAIEEGPNQIQRENSQRRIMVGFNVRGRDVQSLVAELRGRAEKEIKLPPGYYITYGGAFENLEAAKGRLLIAVPLSLALIFLLLYFAFNSMRQGLLIYSAIPLSAMGGILALTLRGMPFSISAGVGFIALFGVAVLNGIVLIAEFNRLRQEGHTDLQRVVLQGTKIRLRPVLMTAFVASLGFLPMALSHGEGAEVQRPLATVVIGGLMIATFLTLFVLPILYLMFEQSSKPGKPGAAKPAAAVLALLLFISLPSAAGPGKRISLQQAIDSALQHNLDIKTEQVRTRYFQEMIGSANKIPATTFQGEYGQINSFYTDTRVGVSQSLQFPRVYRAQRQLLTEQWKSALLETGLRERELRKEVMLSYYHLQYLEHKLDLLQRADSLFGGFLQKAELRLKLGESNVLEKVTAENQQGQVDVQRRQVQAELDGVQAHFGFLLNTSEPFMPLREEAQDAAPQAFSAEEAGQWLTSHPALGIALQQQQTAAAQTATEKAGLLPELTLGYNIMGMKGMGADNKNYDRLPRFQSLQVGLGVPLVSGAQKARIRAAQTMELVSGTGVQARQQRLATEYRSALIRFREFDRSARYYRSQGLNNARAITETANRQFSEGEINYLDWVVLIHQAISIESDYLEAVFNRNRAAAELRYFLEQ